MDEDTFLRRVDVLFEALVEDEGDAYDDVIYRVERPLRRGLIARISGFLDRDGDADPDDATPATDVDRAVAESHYPDTSPLLDLQDDGLDLPLACGLLHFYQPAYPLYRREAVAALQAMGRDVGWVDELSPKGLDVYREYERTIQDLADRVHFRHFPEIHYYRQRIVEGALVQADRDGVRPG